MKQKLKTFAIAAITSAIGILSATPAQAYSEPYCREYNETFQIGGRTQQGFGTACMQPDGTWQKQGSVQNESYELQKQNVVYVIDRQPVQIYHPYRPYGYVQPYRAQPSTFFSVSLGNNYGYHGRPNYYYHNKGHHNNHRWDNHRGRGHGRDNGHGGHRGWNR